MAILCMAMKFIPQLRSKKMEFYAERVWKHGDSFMGRGVASVDGFGQIEATISFVIGADKNITGYVNCQDLG